MEWIGNLLLLRYHAWFGHDLRLSGALTNFENIIKKFAHRYSKIE